GMGQARWVRAADRGCCRVASSSGREPGPGIHRELGRQAGPHRAMGSGHQRGAHVTESISRLAAALADRYRIERELGQGGMATVYLAEDLKHRRKVAIKVLRQELAASLGADRFLREVHIAAQLQHPHVLTLIDSGEADGFLYYVMPL